MALIRWSPFRDVVTMQGEMDRLVDDLLRSRSEGNGECALCPAADVAELEREYQVHFELPGMDMKDIKVRFTNDLLVVQGEKKQAAAEKGHDWRSVERSYGTFERSFRFPLLVQGDKVKAKYSNGVLTVTVPKAETVTPREIQIEG